VLLVFAVCTQVSGDGFIWFQPFSIQRSWSFSAGTYHDGKHNFVKYRADIGKNNGSLSRAPAGIVEEFPHCTYDDLADALFSGEVGLYSAIDNEDDDDENDDDDDDDDDDNGEQ